MPDGSSDRCLRSANIAAWVDRRGRPVHGSASNSSSAVNPQAPFTRTIDLMDRYYAQVLSLGADLYLYHHYPRSVDQPERAMAIIGKHLRAFAD